MLCKHLGWCVDPLTVQILGTWVFLVGVGLWQAISYTIKRRG